MTSRLEWESWLRTAREAEASGLWDEARRSYLRALRGNPASGDLELDFARFLEGRNRLRPAQERLERALRLGASPYDCFMALGRVREKLGLVAAACEAFRKAADAAPASPWPCNERARLLTRGGRLAQARRAVDQAAARRPDGAAHAWPELFSALLCARRYREAFRLAETMLDRCPEVGNPNSFQWPWWHRPELAGSRRFLSGELERLRRAQGRGGSPAWFAYCRGTLLMRAGTPDEVMAEYRRLGPARRPGDVYRHHPFVTYRLSLGDCDWTVGTCRRLLRLTPGNWGLRCRMAEAWLVQGREAAGLREFEQAQAGAEGPAKTQVMTWRGAALLWVGRYREAQDVLDGAVAAGALSWARGWRGAARLKLGDLRGALADLDQAAAGDPRDVESRVWRGEAYRLLGRHSEAVRELTFCLRSGPANDWAFCNRALARQSLGDEPGSAADCAAVSRETMAFIRGRLGRAAGMRRILLEGLRLAKGIRRPDAYLRPIWMRAAEVRSFDAPGPNC